MKLALSPAQNRELARLHEAAPTVRFVVIGAVAANCHVALPRTTGDVDLAIDLEQEETEDLLRGLGWEQRPKQRHRWTRWGDFVADVIPASASLVAGGALVFDEGRQMNLAGFDLVFAHSEKAEAEHGAVEIASLPTILFLKMVAWLDRPHERRKDLNDIGSLLGNYLPTEDARRWSDELSGRRFETQGAFLAGLELKPLLSPSHRLFTERFFLDVRQPSWLREVEKGIDSLLLAPESALDAFVEGLSEEHS